MLKIKSIKPMFDSLVTTMNKYEDDETLNGTLIDTSRQKGCLKEYQTVVAVGPNVCKDIKVGDMVMINPIRYAKMKHQKGSLKDGVITDNPVIGYEFKTVTINDEECLYLQSTDIMYSFEGEEIEDKKDDKKSNLIIPDNKIIC